MAGIVWPVDAVAGAPSYTGRLLRQASLAMLAGGATAARPFGAFSGVRPGTSPTTVTATSTTWTSQIFGGIIDGESSNLSGAYGFSFNTVQTGSVTPSNAANPRIDALCAQVSDPAEGDGSSVPKIDFVYVNGTAAGSPVAPAAAARSFIVALLTFPAGTGTTPTVTWVAPYSYAAGGTGRVALFSQLPATATQGDMMLDISTGITWRWYDLYNGSTNPSGRASAGWKPWETAVPINYYQASQLVNYTPATDTPVLTWSARSGQIKVEGNCTITTGGGFSGSNFAILVPFTMAARYATGNKPVGKGTYLVPGTIIYDLGIVSAAATDRVTPLPMNAAAAGSLPFQAGLNSSLPVAQAVGNSVAWLFEYDPA